eukprot:104133-Prymnesium_polylepis.1
MSMAIGAVQGHGDRCRAVIGAVNDGARVESARSLAKRVSGGLALSDGASRRRIRWPSTVRVS